MDNIDDQLVVNDCNPEQTLEELLMVSQEVFFPLISDVQNQVEQDCCLCVGALVEQQVTPWELGAGRVARGDFEGNRRKLHSLSRKLLHHNRPYSGQNASPVAPTEATQQNTRLAKRDDAQRPVGDHNRHQHA